jgi:hypothetical protein
MPPGFWAILIAGLIGALGAITGVLIQRHFERKDRLGEEDRQMRAVACALVFEMDDFYWHYVAPLRSALADFNYTQGDSYGVALKFPPVQPFPIYRANAHRIGEFEENEVEAIVAFYSLAEAFVCELTDAVRMQSHLRTAISGQNVLNDATRIVLRRIGEILPKLTRAGREAAPLLAERADLVASEARLALLEEKE